MDIEQILFDIAEALRVPVLVLTLIAFALVIVEFGALMAELFRRRDRSAVRLEAGVEQARAAVRAGDTVGARAALASVSWSVSMLSALAAIIEHIGKPDAEARAAKALADFDYVCIRRLERTRILVRFGPALGLMGTLIPLSPALAGLANGDVVTLTENLRLAFSVTVAGLLIGAFAFAISLVRDRLYGQDFSDAEYIANALVSGAGAGPTATMPVQVPPPAGVAP